MKKQSWHRVKAPMVWRPRAGEELVGVYLKTGTKSGEFGEYLVHYIKARDRMVYISGAMLNDLFPLVQPEAKVKLVYLGKKVAQDSDREYKVFELYTEEAVEFKLVECA